MKLNLIAENLTDFDWKMCERLWPKEKFQSEEEWRAYCMKWYPIMISNPQHGPLALGEGKKKKTPKPEDFDERTACHMQCDLEHSEIEEARDKDFFSYDAESKDMWNEKIKEAKDEFNVDFNTENDDSMDQQRVIEIERGGDKDPVKFACEMYSAGGDWEFPLRYFRCELKDGYVEGLSKYTNPHFVFVPNGEQGNGQLTKSDKGTWICPESDFDDEEELRDEKKCWESLKAHLQELAKKEISEARKRFQLDPGAQEEIAALAKKQQGEQTRTNVSWWNSLSEQEKATIIAKRKATQAKTLTAQAPEREKASERTKQAKKHAKFGLQAEQPKTLAQRDQKAVQATHARNRKLHESTCSRARPTILQRYRQSVVPLGIPSHSKPQKLRHIS
jgi:hypothetical protein